MKPGGSSVSQLPHPNSKICVYVYIYIYIHICMHMFIYTHSYYINTSNLNQVTRRRRNPPKTTAVTEPIGFAFYPQIERTKGALNTEHKDLLL